MICLSVFPPMTLTYLAFHLIFTLPPILLMVATLPRPLAGVGGRRGLVAIPLLCLIAFIYTTPWDNYLVANEIWWYGDDRVLATIGYVPVEEYAFFILQPILTGLFLYHYLSRTDETNERTPTPRWIGSAFWLAVSIAGWWMILSGIDAFLYMGLILGWSAPILAFLWLYDGPQLWQYRRTMLVTVGLPTVYLWIADAIAINNGIWTISPQHTIGIEPFGLPVEEATFFLMTNLMVVKGILLFLDDAPALFTTDTSASTQQTPA